MALIFGTHWGSQIIDHLLRNDPVGPAPAAIWIGMLQGQATPSGLGGTDITAQIRAAGRIGPVSLSAPVAKLISNVAALTTGSIGTGGLQVDWWTFWATQAGNTTADFIMAAQPINSDGDLVSIPTVVANLINIAIGQLDIGI